jgi:hypothetical protein
VNQWSGGTDLFQVVLSVECTLGGVRGALRYFYTVQFELWSLAMVSGVNLTVSSGASDCDDVHGQTLTHFSLTKRRSIRRESPSESWKKLPNLSQRLPNLSQRRPRIRTKIGGRARPKVGSKPEPKGIRESVQK